MTRLAASSLVISNSFLVSSTSSIGTVGPGRGQEWHVIMGVGISDAEPHRDAIQEGRLRGCDLLGGEIVTDSKDQLIDARDQLIVSQQRDCGASIFIRVQRF